MKRVFAALPVPEEIARNIIDHSRLSGNDEKDNFKWIAPETAHLTLAFLGTCNEEEVEMMLERLAAVQTPAFDVVLSTAVAFPSRGNPRVLAVEPLANSALERLCDQVRAALEPWLRAEARRYRPHVTLARSRNKRLNQVFEYVDLIQSVLPQSFRAHHFTYYESATMPDRAYYSVVKDFALL